MMLYHECDHHNQIIAIIDSCPSCTIASLQDKITRLSARGIEDMQFEIKVLREAFKSLKEDDYLWPNHRVGSEYTPHEFAEDVLNGEARLWSNEKAFK